MPKTDITLTLYPSRRKWILVTIIGLVLGAGGIFMVLDGDAGGWFPIGFFSLVAVVGIVSMLPSAGYLQLTPEGFTMTSLYRSHFVPWRNIMGFGQTSMHHNTFVTYRVTEAVRAKHKAHAVAQALTGLDAMLPDTYGMRTEDLIALLEQWRARYS